MLRRSLIATATASVAIAGLSCVPALASERTLTIDCRAGADLEFSANPGDTVVVVMGPSCDAYMDWMANRNGTRQTYTGSGFLPLVSYDPQPEPDYVGVDPTPGGWWVYQTGDGDLHVTTTLADHDGVGTPLEVGSVLMTYNNAWAVRYAGPVAVPSDEGTPIPDVIQQVGAPAGGCTAVDDAALNWGGVKSGGWTSSWAEWADGGTGGSVCTRTLHYDHGWTVTAAS